MFYIFLLCFFDECSPCRVLLYKPGNPILATMWLITCMFFNVLGWE